MNRIAPLWKALVEGPAFWFIRGPHAGIILLAHPGTGDCLGAFAFRDCPDMSERLVKILRTYSKAGASPRIKIVSSSPLAAAARAAAAEIGFEVEKVVERSGEYEVRFNPANGILQVTAQEAPLARPPRIRVLIVDDSPLLCSILSNLIGEDRDLEVVGTVGQSGEVLGAIERLQPDVITLDLHLPQINGVDLLRLFMPRYNIPTILFTSVSHEEGPLVLNALEAGAVDYIQKPSSKEIVAMTPMILGKIKAAAKIIPRPPVGLAIEKVKWSPGTIDPTRLIAIGSSTGGTKALMEIFQRLPKEIPPILVAQHIPAGFSKAFADRLNSICDFEVTEAKQGEIVCPGKVIVAPGGKQMRLLKTSSGFTITLDDSQSEMLHKPSVDVLFNSVCEACGPEAIAVLLTGMGSDGAKGMLALKNAGCFTIAQDEASCIVYGMPQAAMQLNAVTKMLPLLDIAQELINETSGRNRGEKKAG